MTTNYITKISETKRTNLYCLNVNYSFSSHVLFAFVVTPTVRLVHPLSPRGKLVHAGLEGLAATNRLVTHAVVHKPECVLRDRLYRVALTEKNVKQLQKTSQEHPDWCEWVDPEQMKSLQQATSSLGGVQLSNGDRKSVV